MQKKQRKFVDDGIAVWIDGDDTSTVFLNEWLNPKGKSFMDFAVHIRGTKVSKCLHLYVPFKLDKSEIEDLSLKFDNTRILQAIFSSACIIDYKKNEYTSEVAYNGKTVDIIHVSLLDYQIKELSVGTLISIDFEHIQNFIDNDESYMIFRMPHKTIDEVFKPHVNVGNVLTRIRDLITSPVLSEKYGYSIRINESRLLPEEITKIGAFHRQKLKKAVITISIDEDYEISDSTCYRIRRLEEDLYKGYLPEKYNCDNVITYQWNQNREYNLLGRFNFYFNIAKDSISKRSMFVYMILLLGIGVIGNIIATIVQSWIGL